MGKEDKKLSFKKRNVCMYICYVMEAEFCMEICLINKVKGFFFFPIQILRLSKK